MTADTYEIVDRLEACGTALCREAAAALRVQAARIEALEEVHAVVREVLEPVRSPRLTPEIFSKEA